MIKYRDTLDPDLQHHIHKFVLNICTWLARYYIYFMFDKIDGKKYGNMEEIFNAVYLVSRNDLV